jgi:cell division protein ZapA
MATVTIQIGDRPHSVNCRPGEEARVRVLGQMVDQRWAAAERAAGGQPERAMLFVALMMADALEEAESRPPEGAPIGEIALDRLADRLEKLADALEQGAPNP